jgi:hypothetical protein
MATSYNWVAPVPAVMLVGTNAPTFKCRTHYSTPWIQTHERWQLTSAAFHTSLLSQMNHNF